MTNWRVLSFVLATLIVVEAKQIHHEKREIKSSICDPVANNTNKIQCYCTKSSYDSNQVKSAECYPTTDVLSQDDRSWDSFNDIREVNKLTFTNMRGNALKYIPTNALKYTKQLRKLDVKYGNIETVEGFAFANMSLVKEISLSDDQIKILKVNAFAHHRDLKSINLDTNSLTEINRDVFIDLPLLEKLYLSNNKITTIHDRAFVHLSNLKELEIDRNNIFSLNSETFSGLKNLDKLYLSSNGLEVIGDNTFLPLIRLRILNLDGNKIQMIDERGFNGLSNLQVLSLAHNALTNLDNVKIFEGLNALSSLSLKANQLHELKREVIAANIHNFYDTMSSLDVDDNNFPCDCRLDWFVDLMNKTSSKHLKHALENLKCLPDPELRDKYNNSAPIFEDEQDDSQKGDGSEQGGADYEFYDDSQLNGKLFYTDLRFLLNCSEIPGETTKALTTTIKPVTKVIEVTSAATTTKGDTSQDRTVKEQITNKGLLDLSQEASANTEAKNDNNVTDSHTGPENQEKRDQKPSYTTSRLATVSAKPADNKYEEHSMASDEAKPDKIKAYRSIQDEIVVADNSGFANKNMEWVLIALLTVLLGFTKQF